MSKRGKLFVISGPSGVGKDTLVGEVLKDLPDLERVVTATTRKPRAEEQNGINYWFISAEEFDKRIRDDDFLEWANVHDNRYGSPRDKVYEELARGKSMILAVDVQGANKIREKMREAVTIFIVPPSLKELRKRLVARSTEDAAAIERRVAAAKNEMRYIDSYDFAVVNKDVGKASEELLNIIKS